MKNYAIALILFLSFFSCNRDFDRAIKSADKDVILKTANKYYEKKKWEEAISLYERLPKLVNGTNDAPDVVYRTAYSNYYLKQYRYAAHQFKMFSNTFSQDPRKEEAAYLAALCYYQGSLEYELDQENTFSAINELQEFINQYPNSDRSKNINGLIDELSNKIEFKAFENARKYFKMSEYKAAIVSFENVLNDFPATKLKTKINSFILTSKFELALNSVYALKDERLQTAIAYCKLIEKENNDAELVKKAKEYNTKLQAENIKFVKLKNEVEQREKEFAAKLERLTQSNKKKLDDDKKEQDIKKNSFEIGKKSAENSTPEPKSVINIKNYIKN